MSSKANEENTTSAKPAVASPQKEKHKRTALYTENLPTFFVGPGNNAEL